MSVQGLLFDLAVSPAAPVVRRSAAAAAVKRPLDVARGKLAAARLALDDARANLSEVCMHLNASGRGIISGEWWDGALHFGALDVEFYRQPRAGRYPRRARRWLRRLVRGLRFEVEQNECLVAELTAHVEVLAALVEPSTLNRDCSAR